MGTPGYAGLQNFARPDGPFRVHRFAYADDIQDLTRYASGLERVANLVRGVA